MPDFLPRPESSPLAALAVPATVVPETTPCEEVEAVFRCDPALRSIVVDCGSGRLVVLDRNRFAAHLAGPLGYGRAIYARRPVSALMDEPALVLSAAMDCSATASSVLARGDDQRYTDLIVRFANGDIGTVSVARLLEELAGSFAHQAQHDPLTGLPNRTLFAAQIDEGLRRQGDNGVAVLFCDLDRFKVVNDSLGHSAGDELLISVAERLRSAVRDEDVVARLGGDEFGVLLVPGSERLAVDVAHRIMRALATPLVLRDRSLIVDVSIGVALARNDKDAEAILRGADAAMYRAKRAGGARYAIDQPCETTGDSALDIETSLRRAIDRGELLLHYQPKVDLVDGSTTGVEALVRWQRASGDLIPPAGFIPLAEETGLIVPMGRWILRTACAQAAEWRARGVPVAMSVNLSAKQMENDQLISDVRAVLSDTGLPADLLWLEVTETIFTGDVGAATARLHALRNLGVRLSIDDFGTGYSNLMRLLHLPIDELKLDRSFLGAADDTPAALAIIRLVIACAHELGIRVTAEGVEHAEHLALLSTLGCDEAQGYFLGCPAPADEVLALLQSGVRLPGASLAS